MKVFFDSPPDDCAEAARATLRPSSRSSTAGDASVLAAAQQPAPAAAAGAPTVAPVDEAVALRIAALGSPDRGARLTAARELSLILNGADVDGAIRLFAALTRVTDWPVFSAQGLNGRYNLFVVLSETGPFRDRIRRGSPGQLAAYNAVAADLMRNIARILREAQEDTNFIGSQTRRQVEQTRDRTPL